MDKEILVYVDLEGQSYLAGRLWARLRKGRESATFEYDCGWLESPVTPRRSVPAPPVFGACV